MGGGSFYRSARLVGWPRIFPRRGTNPSYGYMPKVWQGGRQLLRPPCSETGGYAASSCSSSFSTSVSTTAIAFNTASASASVGVHTLARSRS